MSLVKGMQVLGIRGIADMAVVLLLGAGIGYSSIARRLAGLPLSLPPQAAGSPSPKPQRRPGGLVLALRRFQPKSCSKRY